MGNMFLDYFFKFLLSKHENIHLRGLPEILDKATLPSYAQPTQSSNAKTIHKNGCKRRTKKQTRRTKKQTRRTRKRRQKRSLKKRRKSRK